MVVPVVPRYVVEVVVVLVNVVVVVPARNNILNKPENKRTGKSVKERLVCVEEEDVALLEVDVTEVCVVEAVPRRLVHLRHRKH